MNKGTILAIIVLAGYIGFEVYAINKVSYRMEGLYIFDQYVSAQRAFSVCNKPEGKKYEKFLRNLAAVRRRALKELAEEQPEVSADEIQHLAALRETENQNKVDTIINAKGCEDKEVWTLLKRFEIYAKLNVG